MYRVLHRSLALVTVVGCHAAPPAAALDTSFAMAEYGLVRAHVRHGEQP
jgi:hypothetical protein